MSNSIEPAASGAQLANSAALKAPLQSQKVPSAIHAPDISASASAVMAKVAQDRDALRESLHKSLEQLNQQMSDSGRNLNFSMDEAIDRVVITVRHAVTGEVIRQIPDETLLRVAHNLENVRGMLLNEST